MTRPQSNSRRRMLVGSLMATVGLAVAPQKLWADIASYSVDQRLSDTLEALCDLVIPATDTPGAVAVETPKFVEFAIRFGMKNAEANLVARFVDALNSYVKADFHRLPKIQQMEHLARIDAGVFSREVPAWLNEDLKSWRTLKGLIVIGYYSSEIGASTELRYNLIPGHFDGDVPLENDPRAWSSDWTGVKFG